VRYRVQLGQRGQPFAVDLVELPNGGFEASIDGRLVELDAARTGERWSVRIDGRVVDLVAQGRLPDLSVSSPGLRARIHVENDRTLQAAPVAPRTLTSKVVLSPMPGRVVRVAVQAGDVVRAGQPLVVLEAMKMENEVVAEAEATVLEVHVSVGTAISASAKLVTLGAVRAAAD
jgi:biotin carboxyl carrier protein